MAHPVMEASPHPVDVYVGWRVVERRLVRRVSQSQLAAALGLTFQQVQKYEKGANRISASKLYDISTFLEIDIGYFFAGFERNSMHSDVSVDPDSAEPAPTHHSIEIAQIAPRLTVSQQKLTLELMRHLTKKAA